MTDFRKIERELIHLIEGQGFGVSDDSGERYLAVWDVYEDEPLSNLVVTCPKSFWREWLAEGECAGDPPTGGNYCWYMRSRKRPPIQVGDRLYVVAHGLLRGYAPVIAVVWSDEHGDGHIERGADAVAVTIDRPMPGFQGWRYTNWPREEERPFPDWKTAGVPQVRGRAAA